MQIYFTNLLFEKILREFTLNVSIDRKEYYYKAKYKYVFFFTWKIYCERLRYVFVESNP